MNLDVEIFGVEEASDRFAGIERRSRNLSPVLDAIADEFFGAERSVFDGSPDLVRTGALQASLTESGAAHQVRRVTPDELVAGTDLWYAVFHTERLLEPVDDRLLARWEAMFGDYLVHGTVRSGLGL